MVLRCLAGLLLAAAASSAQASAWAQPKGKGQVILKAEVLQASKGYDASGALGSLPEKRTDRAAGMFAEYGLTDQLTLQFKGDWQSGEDAFFDYEGRGPVELGVSWQAYRDDRNAVGLYAGYSVSGEGRNAGYEAPGVGGQDWEVRVSAGRSLGGLALGPAGRWGPDRSFIEVQAARRMRDGLPDETRADFTVGGHFGRGWMVLGQAFGGITDGSGPRWLSVETSVVRNLGRWSVQAGWRRTVAGRETPLAEGAVLAVWRRF
jgi:opacity protein-like surface antigen